MARWYAPLAYVPKSLAMPSMTTVNEEVVAVKRCAVLFIYILD